MEYTMLGLFFSTVWSWAFLADCDSMNWNHPTTWIGCLIALPGVIMTLTVLSPLFLLYFMGDKLNEWWVRKT